MNVPIAIPAHVGADGIWVEFVSPTSGKVCAINLAVLIEEKRGGLTEDALAEWMLAQLEVWKLHNPLQEMPTFTGFPAPRAPQGALI